MIQTNMPPAKLCATLPSASNLGTESRSETTHSSPIRLGAVASQRTMGAVGAIVGRLDQFSTVMKGFGVGWANVAVPVVTKSIVTALSRA